MKMLPIVIIGLVLVLMVVACGGGSGADGWAKTDRVILTQDCIENVIAEGDLSRSYASRYCRCWVHGMEAHYTAEYAATVINGDEMPDPELLNIWMGCLSEGW